MRPSFNSLSRDHAAKPGPPPWLGGGSRVFQLPLSGSPTFCHFEPSAFHVGTFQLPLSGSLVASYYSPWNAWVVTFNSLSRDHGCPRYAWYVYKFRAFNSLSRDHGSHVHLSRVPATNSLSTPSLGITLTTGERKAATNLSTPSLGITRLAHPRIVDPNSLPFNSLSRDHRARFRDFSALRGVLPRHPFAQMISKTTIWIYRFAPL